MLQDPTTGVKGAEPQKRIRLKGPTTEATREEISQLSAQYLRRRNSAINLKNTANEIDLALRRSTLVEKKLVERQATFLLVNLRAKLLNMQSHAHKFTGTEINLARKILREIGLSVLNEIRDLPNCVEPGWLQKVERSQRLRPAGNRLRISTGCLNSGIGKATRRKCLCHDPLSAHSFFDFALFRRQGSANPQNLFSGNTVQRNSLLYGSSFALGKPTQVNL